MTAQKLKKWVRLEWTFGIISFLFGATAFLAFLVVASESADTLTFSQELLVRIIAGIACLLFGAISLLFGSLASYYKEKFQKGLERLALKASFIPTYGSVIASVEEDRRKRLAEEIDIKF